MRRTLLLASLILAAAPALAQDTSPAPAAPAEGAPAAADAATSPTAAAATSAAPVGDAARGRQLTYTCQGCHGVTGYKNAYPNYHVPKIGGQAAAYLSNALHDYQRGARKHPTMQAQAESFSDQDIADIAAYLSGLK